jgi:Protein of unknown function (DUF3037)
VTRYVYSTVRIVPRVGAGEAVNFAVIAGSDQTGEWEIRPLRDTGRARRFAGVPATAAAHMIVERLMDQRDRMAAEQGDLFSDPDQVVADALSEQYLAELATFRRSVVQFSAPLPILADTADEALEIICSRSRNGGGSPG